MPTLCLQTNSALFFTIILILGALVIGYRWGFNRCLTKKLNLTYQRNLAAFRENVKKGR